ncbi:hypothetical protein BT63DRAFT_410811 [Microthyrium microscopicum]|uniref:ER transporter 6TM N-terminal domain-containing protein n=1 Tax=Microthyrium microscopicum TaxID=703497 RepID=A0A6A6UNK4_9PEZI|nr:hypothetical protein BT63DRAFT_410811 [Microthyrium microscopicum]
MAIAMYRNPAVATVYGNFGFLIALASILSLHLQPRARFQQNIVTAVFLTCLAAAVALLSHFAGLQARKHTKPSGAAPGAYNSSASVVNAIFLCLIVWTVSALRSAYPQLTIPLLISTIFSIVAISNGPELMLGHNSLILCKQLLYCYLTGFGISTVVSLAIFPRTSRSVFIESSHQFAVLCRDLLQKEQDLLRSSGESAKSTKEDNSERNVRGGAVKSLAMRMISSMSSLRDELHFASQEIAIGRHDYADLENLLHRLESLMVPILGLSKMSDFTLVSEPFSERLTSPAGLTDATVLVFKNAIKHLDSALQLVRSLPNANGLFSPSGIIIPGNDENKDYDEKLEHILVHLNAEMASKINRKNDELPEDNIATLDPVILKAVEENLYVIRLLKSASVASDELLQFSRALLLKSTTEGWHFMYPRFAHMPIFRIFLSRHQIYERELLNPEHLAPRNKLERLGNRLRKVLSMLGSDSSKFGLRVLAATMSIGIMAFLESTQHFFVRYRVLWAVVMTPISMSPTAGTAIYGFIGRAAGVTAAMLLAYVNWYIVDGKTAGVVVMFFFSMMLYYFLLLKYPRFIVLFILAAANHVLIIGYELQLSVKVPTPIVSPQRYFPVYTLAPYRLLCVLAGLFVAFIFTIFPVQISEHKILRKDVGTALALLTTYSSSVSASLDQRIRGLEGDISQASSPGRILKATRNEILFKELALLSKMRQISAMIPWEIELGGRFPKSSYDQLVDAIQSSIASLSVIAYVSQTFPNFEHLPSNEFVRDHYTSSLLHPTSNKMATTLSLLALSLSTGTQLTPGFPSPFKTRRQRFLVQGVDKLRAQILADPNFEAFLVVDVASAQLLHSLELLVETTRELVGTMNFSEEESLGTTNQALVDSV